MGIYMKHITYHFHLRAHTTIFIKIISLTMKLVLGESSTFRITTWYIILFVLFPRSWIKDSYSNVWYRKHKHNLVCNMKKQTKNQARIRKHIAVIFSASHRIHEFNFAPSSFPKYPNERVLIILIIICLNFNVILLGK